MTQLTTALFTGDPAGIGSELVQKLLNHGIDYDIAGQNLANPQAMFNAFDLACRMGLHHQQNSLTNSTLQSITETP